MIRQLKSESQLIVNRSALGDNILIHAKEVTSTRTYGAGVHERA